MPTILHRLHAWAEKTPGAPAQSSKQNSGKGFDWKTQTSADVRNRVNDLALFLQARGFGPGDAGAIFSYNCPEWVQVHLATQLIRARSAGIYPNSSAKDVQYILTHLDATLLTVQNQEYFKKLTGAEGAKIPGHIRMILVLQGKLENMPAGTEVVTFEQALEEGRKYAKQGKPYADLLKEIDPKAGAFVIYTSGTTGNPKGALLSQDNLIYTVEMVRRCWKLPKSGVLFSFLPLCHVAETLHGIGVGIGCNYHVYFCSKFDNVSTEIVEAQPTMLLSVPRLWEKMMEGVQGRVRRSSGLQRRLAEWALATGARVADARYSGRTANPLDLMQLKLADRLVLGKIRQAMGLGRAELLASGAAALPAIVSKWFRSIGLEILEDFGQTESTGVICMTLPGVECAGTVGKPVEGTEVKIAEDGEILCRGRNVFVGYFKDDAATAATVKDGWLMSGDLGKYDERGLLRIQGRKKEIVKTSGGKMVAPAPIEEKLKESEIISQACVVGDNRKYISAIVTLSDMGLKQLETKGKGAVDSRGAVTDPELIAEVKKQFDAVNQGLASYEQIKRFTVLGREFSVADGEMTPTLKMKRNVIEKRFAELIEAMYA